MLKCDTDFCSDCYGKMLR